MGKCRFIGLHIQADYPLKSIKPNIYYVVTLNKEKKRCANFFTQLSQHKSPNNA